MADPDDIDKLLREIDSMGAGGGSAKASGPSSAAPAPKTSTGGKGPWVGAAAAGAGATSMVAGMLLPYLGMFQAGIGGAIGGAVVGLVSNPPRWFTKS